LPDSELTSGIVRLKRDAIQNPTQREPLVFVYLPPEV
jgi:hypothetical protein